MRELFPAERDDVDPIVRYGHDDRSAAPDGRPWLLLNMISTVDGATAIDGRSGGLGGPADKLVFQAVRAVADIVLVGAGTVRAENYGPPRVGPRAGEDRRRRGQAAAPRLAIVTGSLDLDPDSRVFVDDEPGARPIVVTTSTADAGRRAALAERADVLTAGDATVDLVDALRQLRARGDRVVVCEGGPSLNGQLVAADLVDELTLTLSPLLAAGQSARVTHGTAPDYPLGMALDRILEEDGLLFLRYLRTRELSGASGRSPS